MADDAKDPQHPDTAIDTPLAQEFARKFNDADLLRPTGFEKTPIPTPRPLTPIQKESATPATPESSLPRLRTFKDDLAEVIKTEHISTVQVAAAEQEKRARVTKEAQVLTEDMRRELHESRVRRVTVTVATALVVLGLSLGIGLYLASQTSSTPGTASVAPIIFVDRQVEIPADTLFGRNLGDRLVSERDAINLRLGAVVNLYPTKSAGDQKTPLAAQSFLKLLGTSAPQELTRTLGPQYLLGVHVFDGNQGFLILPTDNYEAAFSGMLQFEDNILNDFYGFFGPPLLPHQAIGTTTPAFTPTFVDKVIRNHDARVLLDEKGKMRLMYSFVDRRTLVITTNENTFAEVISRLQSKRI